ncbi:apyrase-like [Culicoides brevitarsis]|uniref:apyrase-like n=1 Tax=Culicoides brevitarsis TaxID=469753 RepID=UPI00307C0939
MSPNTSPCKDREKCIGGYARLVHMIKYIQQKYKDDHPLYLNAGDNFQGTPWYTMFTWNVTKHFLNMLPADVLTVGNHEFDHGIDGLLPFLSSVKSKLVLSNIDEQSLTFLQQYSKDRIHGRTIINKGGIRIGVIGVIIKTVNEISNTGNITFFDEIQMVKHQANLLAQENVDIIIVLSHCGIVVDKEIAKHGGPLIDVIVGGHSHTYLYNGVDITNPYEKPADTYPLVITQDDGHIVLIVQAGAYGKYVGVLRVKFDDEGNVDSWTGNNIFLSHDVDEDEDIVKELEPWKQEVERRGRHYFGEAKVLIDNSNCKLGECTAGDLLTDAMVESDESILLALHHAGGIRTSFQPGPITFNDLLTMVPFGNTLDVVKISGKTLRDVFEHAVDLDSHKYNKVFRNLLQVSGFKIVYNLNNPINQRAEKILVLEKNGNDIIYNDLDNNKLYEVMIPSFIFKGGDGFTMFKTDKLEHSIGKVDIDVFSKYFKSHKVLNPKLQGRITMKY